MTWKPAATPSSQNASSQKMRCAPMPMIRTSGRPRSPKMSYASSTSRMEPSRAVYVLTLAREVIMRGRATAVDIALGVPRDAGSGAANHACTRVARAANHARAPNAAGPEIPRRQWLLPKPLRHGISSSGQSGFAAAEPAGGVVVVVSGGFAAAEPAGGVVVVVSGGFTVAAEPACSGGFAIAAEPASGCVTAVLVSGATALPVSSILWTTCCAAFAPLSSGSVYVNDFVNGSSTVESP